MTDIQLPITGGCICKAVRFSATAAPVAVRQCWCRDCQYWAAGSATVNVIFERAAVTIAMRSSSAVGSAATSAGDGPGNSACTT